jgi:hypothetical protein
LRLEREEAVTTERERGFGANNITQIAADAQTSFGAEVGAPDVDEPYFRSDAETPMAQEEVYISAVFGVIFFCRSHASII